MITGFAYQRDEMVYSKSSVSVRVYRYVRPCRMVSAAGVVSFVSRYYYLYIRTCCRGFQVMRTIFLKILTIGFIKGMLFLSKVTYHTYKKEYDERKNISVCARQTGLPR